jgi:hypothetical protein
LPGANFGTNLGGAGGSGGLSINGISNITPLGTGLGTIIGGTI